MAEAPTQNEVVLGFHSPTEWVFFPEVVHSISGLAKEDAVVQCRVTKNVRVCTLNLKLLLIFKPSYSTVDA